MGNNLFGEDIAGEIASEMGPLLLPFVLMKQSVAANRTAGQLTGGKAKSYRNFNCRGILDDYTDEKIANTNIQEGDRVALLLGDTLPAKIIPKAGDRLKAEGSVFDIIDVKRDPDAASYTCQVRD